MTHKNMDKFLVIFLSSLVFMICFTFFIFYMHKTTISPTPPNIPITHNYSISIKITGSEPIFTNKNGDVWYNLKFEAISNTSE